MYSFNNKKEIREFCKNEQKKIITNKKNILKYSWDLFIEEILFCSSQMYGPLIQDKINYELRFSRPNDKDSGDSKTKKNQHIEIKSSILTNTNENINIRQIRPWQDVDYIICCIDNRNSNAITNFWYLTKENMQYEIEKCKAVASHGTEKSLENNKTIEKSITLKKGDKNYNRWLTKYGTSLDKLKNKKM